MSYFIGIYIGHQKGVGDSPKLFRMEPIHHDEKGMFVEEMIAQIRQDGVGVVLPILSFLPSFCNQHIRKIP